MVQNFMHVSCTVYLSYACFIQGILHTKFYACNMHATSYSTYMHVDPNMLVA